MTRYIHEAIAAQMRRDDERRALLLLEQAVRASFTSYVPSAKQRTIMMSEIKRALARIDRMRKKHDLK